MTVINQLDWGVESKGGRLLKFENFLPPTGTWIIDVENNNDGSFAGFGMTQNGIAVYFFDKLPQDKNWFSRMELVGHNCKYDVQMLRKWGFNVKPEQIVFDTQLASYVQDSTKLHHGLKPLALIELGMSWPTYKELCGTGKKAVSIGTLPIDIVANYNGCDVLATYRLYTLYQKLLTADQRAYLDQIEMPTMRVILEMEERGVQIDEGEIASLLAEFEAERMALKSTICASLKIENPNSNKQVGAALVALGYRLPKTQTGNPSVGKEALESYQNDTKIQPLIRWSEIDTLVSYFLKPITQKVKKGRLYGSFNQAVTDTGRLSSSGPNLQNIPTRTEDGNRLRGAFIAKPGYMLIDADYSQIEPRLMAHFSQDPMLLRVFRQNLDLYDSVSEAVGLPVDKTSRKISKILWLAMSYNAGAAKLARAAGLTKDQAYQFLDRMKRTYEQFFYWRAKTISQCEIAGGVMTLFGRLIPLDREFAHMGPNYIIQGSAAEINKLGLQAVRHLSPILNVHDEIIFELPAPVDEISDLMTQVCELTVPVEVEIGVGPSWAGAKK